MQGKYLLAIREFQAAQLLCPGEPGPALEIIQSYLAARALGSAEKSAKALLSTHPESELGQFFLAYGYYLQEKFGESAKVLQKLLRQDDNYEDALRLAGMTQYFLNDHAKAIGLFQRSLRLRPGDGEALFFLGASYYAKKDTRAAIGVFRRVLQAFPSSYQAYNQLGLCYEAEGKMDDAIAAYTKARSLARKRAPEYDFASANLADALMKLDRSDDAVPFAEEAAAANPGQARNQYLIAKAWYSRREPNMDEAVVHIQEAIRLDGNYPEAHYLAGRLYYRLGRRDEAEREFSIFQIVSTEATASAHAAEKVTGITVNPSIEKPKD